MLPKRYRKRYSLILLLSVLLHVVFLVALYLNPSVPPQKKEDSITVEVKLKQDEKPKTSEPEPEPKKAEPKKAEPKKAEPKKAEPKKAQPKKAEPKKAEPKKAQPKKAEPEKAEPEKAEPKKAEPEKAEPKKADPKKADPKKADPKKADPKKAEPKKAEPSKQGQKRPARQGGATGGKDAKTAPTKQAPTRPSPRKDPSMDLNSLAYWTKKWGSAAQMDDRLLSRQVVITDGSDREFDSRDVSATQLVDEMTRQEFMQFNQELSSALEHVLKYYTAPDNKWPGSKFDGVIGFLIDNEGNVTNINFKKRSGLNVLDAAILSAIKAASPLPLPRDPLIRRAFVEVPKRLTYSEEDLKN